MSEEEIKASGACLTDWDLRGTRVTPEKLRELLDEYGFKIHVPDINQTSAVKKAARKFTRARGVDRKVRTEVAHEDDEYVVIGILVMDDDGEKRKKYEQVTSVVWNKDIENFLPVHAKDPYKGLMEEVIDSCNDRRSYLDHSFIRPQVIHTVLNDIGAVPYVRKAGAQIVPISNYEQSRKLSELVSRLPNAEMVTSRLVSDEATDKAVHDSVVNGIAAKAEKIRSDIKEWKDKNSHLRSGSIGTRLAQFKDLKSQAELYADCLKIELTDLYSEIEDATAEAQTLLDRALGTNEEKKEVVDLTDEVEIVDTEIVLDEGIEDDIAV